MGHAQHEDLRGTTRHVTGYESQRAGVYRGRTRSQRDEATMSDTDHDTPFKTLFCCA